MQIKFQSNTLKPVVKTDSIVSLNVSTKLDLLKKLKISAKPAWLNTLELSTTPINLSSTILYLNVFFNCMFLTFYQS